MRPIARVLLAVALLTVLAVVTGCTNVPPLPPRAIELNRDGAAALAAGNLATAEARIALALEYSPRFTEAWVNLGYVEMGRGNPDGARKHFRKARALNPDLPAPHHALGLLADERDSQVEAEAYYRSALKVDPGFTPSRVNLARRLYQRGAYEDAREQLLRLTEVAPENAEGWAGLAECLLRLGRVEEADEVVSRGRTRLGEPPQLMLLLARQLMRRGAFADAEAILLPITHDADRHRAEAAWAWLSLARLGAGECRQALDALRQALAIEAIELRSANQPLLAYARGAIEAARTPCR